MSKVNQKYIKWGTGTNDVNSRSLPAHFTPTNYTPAQVASEGADKVSAHLKGVDDFLGTLGSSIDIAETSFSLANNQTTPANVTGFAFSNTTVRSFKALVSVVIDATADLFETIEIIGIQRGADWQISTSSVGDSSGVNFTISTSGQVLYTSTSNVGFDSGTIKFRAWAISK